MAATIRFEMRIPKLLMSKAKDRAAELNLPLSVYIKRLMTEDLYKETK